MTITEVSSRYYLKRKSTKTFTPKCERLWRRPGLIEKQSHPGVKEVGKTAQVAKWQGSEAETRAVR